MSINQRNQLVVCHPFIFLIFPSLGPLQASIFGAAQEISGLLQGLIILVDLRPNFFFLQQQSHVGYQTPVLGHTLCPPACASPMPALCHCCG